MTNTQAPPNSQESDRIEDQAEMRYTLHVRTNMPPRWDEWFDGMEVNALDNQEFILSGLVPDQAALHGLIARVRDLNLDLIQVKKTAPGQPGRENRGHFGTDLKCLPTSKGDITMSQTSTVSQSSFVTKSQSGSHGLKPMPFWLSITLFGLPALLMLASIYRFIPWLTSLGISEVESFLTAHIVPMALLLAAALVGLDRVDGYSLSRDSFRRRFRFPAFRFKDILWGLLIFVALNIGYGIFSQVGTALVSNNIIPIPAGLTPWLDPRISMITQPGLELAGKWGIAALWFVMLLFNITGEELWWRGYILPRQELVHGKWTWLVHGTMWTLFHVFKWWDLIGLLPVCLIIAFAAQRLKNNWPVYIAHFLFNGMGFIFIVAQIMGS